MPKLFKEMLISFGDKCAESAAVARTDKAFEKSEDSCADTPGTGRANVEQVEPRTLQGPGIPGWQGRARQR